jgi:hypothetical protein
VDRVVSFIPKLEASVLVQPTLGTFDHPAIFSKPTAMGRSSAGQ